MSMKLLIWQMWSSSLPYGNSSSIDLHRAPVVENTVLGIILFDLIVFLFDEYTESSLPSFLPLSLLSIIFLDKVCENGRHGEIKRWTESHTDTSGSRRTWTQTVWFRACHLNHRAKHFILLFLLKMNFNAFGNVFQINRKMKIFHCVSRKASYSQMYLLLH